MNHSQETKQALQNAFLALLNERTLNKITVRDITERCGVNRNTFYYHYKDIPALIEEICAGEVEKIVQSYPTVHSIEDCLDAGLHFALKNRRAILHVVQSDTRESYVSSLWRICESTVGIYVDTVFASSPPTLEDRALLIRYYKCLCFGLILDWIGNGMRDDLLDDIHRLCRQRKEAAETLIRGWTQT